MLQVPPGAQDDAALVTDAPPVCAANTDIFFVTCRLPHVGQVTSFTAELLRTNLSNGRAQSSHVNSYMGMILSATTGGRVTPGRCIV